MFKSLVPNHEPSQAERKSMKATFASSTFFAMTLLLLLWITPSRADEPAATASDGEWKQLLGDQDLTGWTPKIKGYPVGENFGDTFRVEDGVLKVRYDKYDGSFNNRFGHLFYNHPFSNYVLRLEYRFVGEQAPNAPAWALRNSGIMIHGQTPQSMQIDQDFPVSIEVQLLGGDGTHPRPTANVCTPGTNIVLDGKLHTPHCTNSSSDTYHGDQWVTVEVEVNGDRLIRHKVNGREVLHYSGPQLDPKDPDARRLLEAGADKMLTGGTISLQSEGHPVEFRNIQLRELQE
jgi:3-keto-disaccharide hydrolase